MGYFAMTTALYVCGFILMLAGSIHTESKGMDGWRGYAEILLGIALIFATHYFWNS